MATIPTSADAAPPSDLKELLRRSEEARLEMTPRELRAYWELTENDLEPDSTMLTGLLTNEGRSSLQDAKKALLHFSPRLLLVRRVRRGVTDYDAYCLTHRGTWERNQSELRWLVGGVATRYIEALAELPLKGESAQQRSYAISWLKKSTSAARLTDVAAHLHSGDRELDQDVHRSRYEPAKRCKEEELDRTTRHLGVANGVVDLHTAKLLPPEVAKEYLVTQTGPVSYNPGVQHKYADQLFSYLEEPTREYLLAVFGRALLGRPGRELYLVVGGKNAGKTTLLTALLRSVGHPYVRTFSLDVAAKRRQDGTRGTTPQLVPLTEARVALSDEVQSWRPTAGELKNLTGGGYITVQKKYEEEKTCRVTATMIGFGNSPPWMRLSDPALADRLKVIPCREIPETDRDPGLKAAFEEEGDTLVRQALLSRLVRSACRYRKGMPTIPPEVVATTERVRAESMSPAERWLEKRLHHQPGQRLSTEEAWKTWVIHCEEEGVEPGKRTPSFVGAMKKHCGVPKLNRFKLKGKVVQGVMGWALRGPRLHEVARVSGTPLREPSLKRLCENGVTSCNRSGNPRENRPEPAQELDAAPAELPGEDRRSFRAPGPLWTPGDETLWKTLPLVVFQQGHQGEKNLIYVLDVEDTAREIREDIEAAAANGVELPSCPTAQGKVSPFEFVSWIRQRRKLLTTAVDDPSTPPRNREALAALRDRRWPWSRAASEEQAIEVEAQLLAGASTAAGFAGNDPEKVEAVPPNLEQEREPGAAIAEALGLPKPRLAVPVDREREKDEEGPL